MSAIEQSFKNVMAWIDDRLPVTEAYEKHLSKYYAPKNLNIWYYFGIFSFVVLANQLLTGIWLTMSYVPTGDDAFASVEYIMRDVEYGWLLRYMHSTGASAFFVVVYLHMFRGLLYGSYQTAGADLDPRNVGVCGPNGGRVFWLFAALGQYVFLGRAGDCFFSQCHTSYRG